MGDRVSSEEVKKASEIHVLDYLNAKGENIIKQGGNYYRHADHDSLIFNENGKWFWNSRGLGGYGAISFARSFYDLSFQNAVRDVNGQEISKKFEQHISDKKNEEFNYPKHYETKTINNAINYLSNIRYIDPKIVLALKKHDLIAEDKLKNIVFKWRDKDGNIVGADKQGTIPIKNNKRGYFKQIMANSKEDGGFTLDIGTPDKIAVFESPIDALSYFDLKRPNNIRLFSMSGLKDRAFLNATRQLSREMTERGENIEEKMQIIIGVDNDSAGEEFRKKWKQLVNEKMLKLDIPKLKDWNKDLEEIRKKEQIKSHTTLEKPVSYSNNKSYEMER